MKKLILPILVMAVSLSYAQSEKFVKAMQSNVLAIDSTNNAEKMLALSNNFQRIADAEKSEWLPFYYASLTQVMAGLMSGSADGSAPSVNTDQMADKAEEMITKAEGLTSENSEIFVVKKMIATLRMMADPMTRWQTYGPIAAEALAKARQLDPENPRIYLLEGQDKFYTPEQFGGSKTEAKSLFEESMKKFESHKPASSIHPQWGLAQVKYFHAQCN